MPGRLPRAAALATALSAAAPGAVSAEERPWYLPDHAKLQLAGNIGFVSPGLGYSFLRRALDADVFLGWVPRAIGGTDILSVTAKASAQPFGVHVGRVELRPVTLGLQLTYTFGDRYFVRPPARFPGDYYDFPTAIRAGIAVGSAATVPVGRGRVGAYVELVALDLMLKAWAENRRTLGPEDVFSVAVGVRAEI